MTGQEGMQFGVFVQQNYAANQSNARTHKDNMLALTTIDEVQNYDFSGGWVR